jgi:hypothetical protein
MPYFQDLFKWLADNKEMLQDWVPVIIKVVAVLAGLSVLYSIGAGLVGLATGLWGAATAFWGAATASTAFGISLAPLLLLGAAVFALGYGIGTVFYNLGDNLGDVWNNIKSFFGSIHEGFNNLAKGLENGSYDVIGVIGGLLMGVVALIANAAIGIANFVLSIINGVIQGINDVSSIFGGGTNIEPIGLIGYMDWGVPALAKGADVMGPTMALIGEEAPETVVGYGRMNDLIDNVNAQFDAQGTGGGDTYITVKVDMAPNETPEEAAWKIARAIEKQQKR